MNEITPLAKLHVVVWSAAYLHIYPEGVSKGRPIAKVAKDQEKAYAIADRFVEAVNAYPALTARVEALEEALRGLLGEVRKGQSVTLPNCEPHIVMRAEAALKEPK